MSKKGIVKPKMTGEVDIIYEQKVKGGYWTQIGEKLHLYLQKPKMTDKATARTSEHIPQLNGYPLIRKWPRWTKKVI